MFVIGVAGQAQNGKDTVADRLVVRLNELSNISWGRSAFAAAVKRVYCETFAVDLEFVEKWKTNPNPPPGFDMPVRQALQFIGDGFRKIKGTIWLDLAFRSQDPVIISDVRYINEFMRIKTEGGMNIIVAHPDRLNDDPNGSEAQIRPYAQWCLDRWRGSGNSVVDLRQIDWESLRNNGEQIPAGIENFDVFICNCGTLEDLWRTVDEYVVPLCQSYVFDFSPENMKEESCPILS